MEEVVDDQQPLEQVIDVTEPPKFITNQFLSIHFPLFNTLSIIAGITGNNKATIRVVWMAILVILQPLNPSAHIHEHPNQDFLQALARFEIQWVSALCMGLGYFYSCTFADRNLAPLLQSVEALDRNPLIEAVGMQHNDDVITIPSSSPHTKKRNLVSPIESIQQDKKPFNELFLLANATELSCKWVLVIGFVIFLAAAASSILWGIFESTSDFGKAMQSITGVLHLSSTVCFVSSIHLLWFSSNIIKIHIQSFRFHLAFTASMIESPQVNASWLKAIGEQSMKLYGMMEVFSVETRPIMLSYIVVGVIGFLGGVATGIIVSQPINVIWSFIWLLMAIIPTIYTELQPIENAAK